VSSKFQTLALLILLNLDFFIDDIVYIADFFLVFCFWWGGVTLTVHNFCIHCFPSLFCSSVRYQHYYGYKIQNLIIQFKRKWQKQKQNSNENGLKFSKRSEYFTGKKYFTERKRALPSIHPRKLYVGFL